jgi:hypothetical protein
MESRYIWGIVVVSIVIGAVIWRRIEKILRSISGSKRRNKGIKGEDDAVEFLEKRGYTILEREPSLSSSMWIDGQEVEFTIKVDLLIQKGDEKAIVEVKRGKSVNKAHVGKTRRQLFEYFHLYDVDRLYFYNSDAKVLQEIQFKRSTPLVGGSVRFGWRVWVWVIGIGVASILLWLVMNR